MKFKLLLLLPFLIMINSKSEEVLNAVSPGEQFVKIVHEELTALLGSEVSELNLREKPSVIFMVGLQGASLNILNMLLNSNRGAKRMIPCQIESLLLASQVIDLSIYRISHHSNTGTSNT